VEELETRVAAIEEIVREVSNEKVGQFGKKT